MFFFKLQDKNTTDLQANNLERYCIAKTQI